MQNVALLVAALEGHGIRLRVVNGRIDVQSDTRAIEREPIELLDELTRDKASVLSFLNDREAQPAPPVHVLDRRGEVRPEPTERPAPRLSPFQVMRSDPRGDHIISVVTGRPTTPAPNSVEADLVRLGIPHPAPEAGADAMQLIEMARAFGFR